MRYTDKDFKYDNQYVDPKRLVFVTKEMALIDNLKERIKWLQSDNCKLSDEIRDRRITLYTNKLKELYDTRSWVYSITECDL